MTNPVGGEAVLLQPGMLSGAEPRRTAEPGAMPPEGFAMMLAGLMAGSGAAATGPVPTPTAETAPPPAPPRQAGALPWDVLAAAAEETSRLAAAFQMPQGALPAETAEAPLASALPDTLPLEPTPALPDGPPEGEQPVTAVFSLAQPWERGVVPSPTAVLLTEAALPEGSPAPLQGRAPEAPSASSAQAPTLLPVPSPGGLADATPEAASLPPGLERTPSSVLPASLPAQRGPQATEALLSVAPSPLPAPAAPQAEPAFAGLPLASDGGMRAIPREAHILAAVSPQQPRSGPPAAVRPVLTETSPDTAAPASAPASAVPTLLPTAITAIAPSSEVGPHVPGHPGEAAPVSGAALAAEGPSAPVATPLPILSEARLDEAQPAPLPMGQAPGTAAPAPAPAAMPTQAPLPQSRLAAEATPQLVLRMAQATRQEGVETISVDLRPPELGRVELQLTFRDGTVQVVMRAEQAETFEALRQERHNLLQQMEQAGLQLGGTGLDLQHGPLPQPRQQPEQAASGTRQAAGEPEQEAEPESEAAASPRRRASDSLIDIIT